jgi:GT2 family glycosyltransferase
LNYVQDFSAVSSACLMVSKSDFIAVNGFSTDYKVVYGDVDFCLKLRMLNKLNVFTPFAELYHNQKSSMKKLRQKRKDENRLQDEKLFLDKWKKLIDEGDPYYNLNFSLDREDYVLKF